MFLWHHLLFWFFTRRGFDSTIRTKICLNFGWKMLIQYTDKKELWNVQLLWQWTRYLLDFMVAESCVKIETHKHNRSEFYFVRVTTVKMICRVAICSQWKTVILTSLSRLQMPQSRGSQQTSWDFICFVLDIWLAGFENVGIYWFCHPIGCHCLGGPAFSKRTITITFAYHIWSILMCHK